MAKWTVQSLIDKRMTVTAYCHQSACNHHQGLDLYKLRDKLGPDATAMSDDLLPKLRCSKCNGKEIGLIYSPGRTWDGVSSEQNAYRKAKGS